MEVVTKVFWATTVLAVPLALLVEPGPLRWVAIGWLALLGIICALANWATIAGYIVRRRSGSMIPLLGVASLGIAVGAMPPTLFGGWRLIGLFLDPWLLVVAVGALVHPFTGRRR